MRRSADHHTRYHICGCRQTHTGSFARLKTALGILVVLLEKYVDEGGAYRWSRYSHHCRLVLGEECDQSLGILVVVLLGEGGVLILVPYVRLKARAYILYDKDDEVILVLEVLVEGGAAYSRLLAELVDGDLAELHICQQLKEGGGESGACFYDSKILFIRCHFSINL